jgi:hypothetical protein
MRKLTICCQEKISAAASGRFYLRTVYAMSAVNEAILGFPPLRFTVNFLKKTLTFCPFRSAAIDMDSDFMLPAMFKSALP